MYSTAIVDDTHTKQTQVFTVNVAEYQIGYVDKTKNNTK